jgi:hypothetical protein
VRVKTISLNIEQIRKILDIPKGFKLINASTFDDWLLGSHNYLYFERFEGKMSLTLGFKMKDINKEFDKENRWNDYIFYVKNNKLILEVCYEG